jgi:3-methylcrotonyl-CoA carboxylase alpha subunit
LPEGPGIRVDSGIENGDEITQFYDPMIAKLIVYGEDRDAAISRLQRALEQSALFGVTTNIPLLHSIALHPAFRKGHTHTGFLNEHRLLAPAPSQQFPQDVLVAAAIYEGTQERRIAHAQTPSSINTQPTNPWQTLGPWRMIGEARRFVYHYQEQEHTVALIQTTRANAWNVTVDGQVVGIIEYRLGDEGLLLLKKGETQTRVYVHTQGTGEVQVMLTGSLYRLERQQPPDVDATAHGGGAVRSQKTLTAPMAGTIVKVHVHDGDSVEALQVLVVLSAMKMEHAIVASHEGKVRHVHYQEGAVVRGGAIIVEME